MEQQSGSEAYGQAVDRGHEWFREVGQTLEEGIELCTKVAWPVGTPQLAEIDAARERTTLTGEYAYRHVRCHRGLVEAGTQNAVTVRGKGVELFRSTQCQESHAAVVFGEKPKIHCRSAHKFTP